MCSAFNDSSKPTRWAIVGTGKISCDFCIALKTLTVQEHQIVAVAARNIESAKSFAEHHGIQKYYGSYESVSLDPDVDVVYIGTRHPTHVTLSMMMLEAGKNVLCEKPMALSSADVKKVIEVAERKKLLFVEDDVKPVIGYRHCVAFYLVKQTVDEMGYGNSRWEKFRSPSDQAIWSRFFPVYKQLQNELKDGRIGTPKGVQASFGADFDWDNLERIFDKGQGGGVVLDLGCYVIQLACLVYNNEKPEKIYVNGSLHHTGVDRSADIMLCYKDGRTALLSVTGECRLPNNAVIHGTKGFIEIASPFWSPSTLKTSNECKTFDMPTPGEPTNFINSVGLVYEIQGVRNALLNGLLQAPEITHADSLLIAEIQDEILRQLGVSYDSV